MPNGKGFAQCSECINFVPGNRPHCKKHNFDFPLIIIGYEILCRDYSPAYDYSEKPSYEIKNLEIGHLFYYCCQGEREYKKLGVFTELKQPIYGIHFLEDKRYQWIFEVKDYYRGLWDKKSIILQYDNKRENFIQRELAKEMFVSYTVATKKVVYASRLINAFVPQDESNELINSFIESFIGLEEYRNKKKRKEMAVVLGVSAFLKRVEDSTYEIVEDVHFKDFLRDE